MADFQPIEPIAAGERLLRDDGADPRVIALTFTSTSSGIPYASSYKDAGDALVKRAIEHHQQDLMLFPALYCYRHAIEIVLKDFLHTFRPESGDEPLNTHRLEVVWRHARRAIEQVWPDGDEAELDAVERLVLELDAVDPDAVQFRFARDRRGLSRPVPEALGRVDLGNLMVVMNRLFILLAGAADGLATMMAEVPYD